MLARALRRAHRDDRGVSMAELLVAASVTVIILATLAGFFVAAIKGSASNASADTNIRQATNAINAMSRYLRAATTRDVPSSLVPDSAIVKATPTDLTFYAYINLIEDRTSPSAPPNDRCSRGTSSTRRRGSSSSSSRRAARMPTATTRALS